MAKEEGLVPIVGIGASAGGLEAFSALLRVLPEDFPFAVVFVQHLDPKHPSSLCEILARHSRLPVDEARHNMLVERGHVYVIPPNKNLTVKGAVLRLTPRATDGGPTMAIDQFLRSLAAERDDCAVGVILSGSATDGVLGLKAIKEKGGITFAQELSSAAHDSMPRNAVAAGIVDFVLSPAAIAKELARLAHHPFLGPPILSPKGEPAWPSAAPDRKALERIFEILVQDTGVDFLQYRQSTIRRRIRRRMLIHKTESLQSYLRTLRSSANEVQALYDELLINVTSFFRDTGAFGALARRVLPQIVKRVQPGESIRVWTPGCATGEETYSLAILLVEALGKRAERVSIQCFGTDLSAAAIQKARAGVYSADIELDVSRERLRRFFVKLDSHYQIRRSIRERCVFSPHNLAKDPPFSKLDLIACRNLLIYLEPPLQKRILWTCHYALKNGGYLMLGASETVGPLAELFDSVDKRQKLFRKKPTTSLARDLQFGIARRRAGVPVSGEAVVKSTESPRGLADIQREVDRILISRFAPVGVVVNEAMEVLQFRGSTSPYLEPGTGIASLNLFKMCREGLLGAIQSAVEQARKKNVPVRREGVYVERSARFVKVDVEVTPLLTSGGERNYLVLFSDTEESVSARKAPKAKGASKPRAADPAPRRSELEAEHVRVELAATKEYLHSIIDEREAAIEELRSANEEIVSSNEELQSLNEELETSKEELQAVNEEISTVNDELKSRNAELTESNNDLTNLLGSVNLAIVLVGGDMRIRRFTPLAERLFNLAHSPGKGRAVKDFRPSIDVPDLAEICARVADSKTPVEREVRDRDGGTHIMRISPYRTATNEIDGVVIILLNVSDLRSSASRLAVARDLSTAIVDNLDIPILLLDLRLMIQSTNRAFHDDFKNSPEDVVGRSLFEVSDRAWDLPDLRRNLEHLASKDATFPQMAFVMAYPSGEKRHVRVNARKLAAVDQGDEKILLCLEDVTDIVKVHALVEADRRKDEFLAVISHELRTPLHAIMGWIELMRAPGVDEKTLSHGFDVLARNAKAQADLIRDLLDVSRIVAGKLELERRRIDLARPVIAAVDLIQPIANNKGVRVNVKRPARRIPFHGDPARLQQVFWNLLSNAVKFTPKGGHVDVSFMKAGGRVDVRVSDSGVGISAGFLPHVFERFRQDTSLPTRSRGGLGLGLAIVRHIVESHGGTVWAESEGPGSGAAFTVRLTVDAGAEDETGQPIETLPAISEQLPSLAGIRVLVVDDEPDALESLRKAFEGHGVEVIAAQSSEEARRLLLVSLPDVIISDIGLPNESGNALITAVRAQGVLVPAIALSAFAATQDRRRALEAGFQLFAAKPIDPSKLLPMVASLVGRV